MNPDMYFPPQAYNTRLLLLRVLEKRSLVWSKDSQFEAIAPLCENSRTAGVQNR